jgi:hypothetical protein
MLSRILGYGALSGLVVGIPLSAMVVNGIGQHGVSGMAIGYLLMLIALSFVFVAIKRYRDIELGGVVRFWPALLLGVGISIVAGIIYVIAWESACAIAHFDFATVYANSLIEQKRVAGASPAELAAFRTEMDHFRTQYADPLFRLPMTFLEIFPVGLLVSLVSAGLLRNPRFLPSRKVAAAA